MRELAKLILVGTFLCASGSYAEEQSRAYQGPDEAAIAGLKAAIKCSHNKVECGGVIVRLKGSPKESYVFRPDPPETSGKPFGVEIKELSQPLPEGKIVADFHVHICSRHNYVFANFFSPADIYVDTGFHIIGYMYSYCDHYVHRIDPSPNGDDLEDEEVDFHSGKVIYLTIGHIVGHIP